MFERLPQRAMSVCVVVSIASKDRCTSVSEAMSDADSCLLVVTTCPTTGIDCSNCKKGVLEISLLSTADCWYILSADKVFHLVSIFFFIIVALLSRRVVSSVTQIWSHIDCPPPSPLRCAPWTFTARRVHQVAPSSTRVDLCEQPPR